MRRILFGLSAALCAYEALALTNRQPGDTISELIWRANARPIVPFMAGVIAGHLFWQQQRVRRAIPVRSSRWTGR